NAFSLQYGETTKNLNKRIQAESVKPADSRDQAALEALNAKMEQAQSFWAQDSGKDRLAYGQKMQDFNNTYMQLAGIVNNYVNTIDQVWLRADLDIDPIIALFAALDKRVDQLKADATPVIDNYKKLCADRERALKE